jgi:N-acetylglucosamine-6-phosphate deacetylase
LDSDVTVALRATRVLTPAGVVDHAVVTVADGLVADVGDGAADRELDGWLVPGLVDMHCHGGAGAGFLTTDPAEIDAAAAFHARAGTTSLIASLVSAPVDELCAALDTIAGVIEAGGTTLVGAHLEGPFLSPDFRGAHRIDHLAVPDADAFARMHAASRGTLRMLTIAPELPGADEVIEAAAELGVVVAVGHTACDYATAAAAFAGRATVTTHLFNAMPPIHHRAPGPVVAALESDAWCELICDGHHLDDAIIRLVADRAPERMVLVTDAMAAAGMPDGPYRLGDHELRVEAGVARLVEGGALAGSTLTLDAAIRRVAAAGVSTPLAFVAATAHPAAALGVTVGSITPGQPADLVWLTDDLEVRGVMHGGRWR